MNTLRMIDERIVYLATEEAIRLLVENGMPEEKARTAVKRRQVEEEDGDVIDRRYDYNAEKRSGASGARV